MQALTHLLPPQALNDSKRLATSGANFARSRTVTDGTCAFPNNVCAPPLLCSLSARALSLCGRFATQLVGCENAAESGSVKYLSDDLKLECQGTEEGKARRTPPAPRLHGAPVAHARACRSLRRSALRATRPLSHLLWGFEGI